MVDVQVQLTTYEICQVCGLTEELLVEIVEQGIIEPRGETPQEWRFDAELTLLAKKAVRLRQELELDWHATAVILTMLDELEQLRADNRRLRQRLGRFLLD